MSKRRRSAQQESEPVSDIVVTPQNLETLSAPKVVSAKVNKPAPLVGLDVFATVGGHKWDQLAGFARYAQSQKLGPCTMHQWREELRKFNDRPIG